MEEMTEEALKTPLAECMEKINIPVITELAPKEEGEIAQGSQPVCGVWHKSLMPTDDELEILQDFADERWERLGEGEENENRCAKGANTITFWKKGEDEKGDGIWVFNRLNWGLGGWSVKPEFLDEIVANEKYVDLDFAL